MAGLTTSKACSLHTHILREEIARYHSGQNISYNSGPVVVEIWKEEQFDLTTALYIIAGLLDQLAAK